MSEQVVGGDDCRELYWGSLVIAVVIVRSAPESLVEIVSGVGVGSSPISELAKDDAPCMEGTVAEVVFRRAVGGHCDGSFA